MHYMGLASFKVFWRHNPLQRKEGFLLFILISSPSSLKTEYLTWQAWAKPVPKRNLADMLGGSVLENWLASLITRRHVDVASITLSVVNSFKLKTDSLRLLKLEMKDAFTTRRKKKYLWFRFPTDPIFFCRPYYFSTRFDCATLFSPGGCGLLPKWRLLSH